MENRRNFIKSAFALTAGIFVASVVPLAAMENVVAGIFAYSKRKPGKWEGKAKSHAPIVTVKGDTITIETKHGMSEKHYIAKHTLLSESGKVLGEKYFSPTDKKAISTFKLTTKHEELFALSLCNLHDEWVTEVTL